ncbi:major facilitator superfamily domain-containing protein [Cercophora samala]|uniref:Major facilitator superfamily domain-containing protein n=1 Tax=Cercophora samala TaxID=330535 RepID=A0AA40D7L3_9PEZI|nr:major facilitator superfamily domain-containing protein [Cercophora samala]
MCRKRAAAIPAVMTPTFLRYPNQHPRCGNNTQELCRHGQWTLRSWGYHPRSRARDLSRTSICKRRHPTPSANMISIYLHRLRLGLALVSVTLSFFCCSMDRAFMGTVLPDITDQFNSLTDMGLYGTGYFVMFGCSQLLWAKLYQFCPTKMVYLAAAQILHYGCYICAVATNSPKFFGGRLCVGLGCGGIHAGMIPVISSILPLAARPNFIPYYNAGLYGIAAILGPVFAGGLTTKDYWRPSFFINEAMNTFGFLGAMLFLDRTGKKAPSPAWLKALSLMDVFDALCRCTAILLFSAWLESTGTVATWSSFRAMFNLAVASGWFLTCGKRLLIVNDLQESRARFFRGRSIAFGSLYVFFLSGSVSVLQYYFPLWLQTVKARTSSESGRSMLPLALATSLSLACSTFVVGHKQRPPLSIFMILGSAIVLIGSALATLFTPWTTETQWIVPQVVIGLGIGLELSLDPNTVAQATLDSADMLGGTVAMMFSQGLGAAVALPIAHNLFMTHLSKLWKAECPGLLLEVSEVDGTTIGEEFSILLSRQGAKGVLRLFLDTGDLFCKLVYRYNAALINAFLVAVFFAATAVFCSVGVDWRGFGSKRSQVKDSEKQACEVEKGIHVGV